MIDVGLGFGLCRVVEIHPNGQVVSYNEDFGRYHLEGIQIFFAFHEAPFSTPLARQGTVSGNIVTIDGDFDFSCD